MKATIAGLQDLRKPEEIAQLRGLSVNAVLGLSEGVKIVDDSQVEEAPAEEAEQPAEAPA